MSCTNRLALAESLKAFASFSVWILLQRKGTFPADASLGVWTCAMGERGLQGRVHDSRSMDSTAIWIFDAPSLNPEWATLAAPDSTDSQWRTFGSLPARGQGFAQACTPKRCDAGGHSIVDFVAQ